MSPPCPRVKASWEVASGRADVAACPHTEVTNTRTPLFASPSCCRALCNTGKEPLLHPQRPELRRKEHIAVVCLRSTPPSNFPGCSWIVPCTRQMQDPETELKDSNSPHSVQLKKKRRMTFHHLFTSLFLLLRM